MIFISNEAEENRLILGYNQIVLTEKNMHPFWQHEFPRGRSLPIKEDGILKSVQPIFASAFVFNTWRAVRISVWQLIANKSWVFSDWEALEPP